METLVLELTRIEHGAAAEAFPQDADIAARNRHHHVGIEHDAPQASPPSSRSPCFGRYRIEKAAAIWMRCHRGRRRPVQ